MRSLRPARALSVFLVALVFGAVGDARAAMLVDVSILDKDFLIVHLSDGDVIHHEGGTGEEVVRYTPELSTSAATQAGNWTIKSAQDGNYGTAGKHPQSCYRKKKLSGHAQGEWDQGADDYSYEYTYEHWVYLRLPNSLQQGMTYTVEIAAAVNSDTASRAVTFDVYNSRSEAIHVNLVGYAPDAPHKAADLYHWMGDGGGRSYASFEGSPVLIYDVGTGASQQVGTVSFWMANGGDVFGYNLLRTDVWSADFSSFTTPGTYRLVVAGVGCSQDFTIASDVYAEPFKLSVTGYYYMRIGEDPTGRTPPPRTPRYIPGVSPANTTVYLTTMHPYHSGWAGLTGGDNWDVPTAWAAYRKTGNLTNANAWGGHSDAADWDRHLGHVSIIYDMLLPYLLTNGAIADDDTGIPESGNGVPDIIDEARNEVDLWLRLRDGAGYSHGLTNPDGSNQLYQAGPTAIAAWANAANAAMLADAYRVAGETALMNQYRDAAITAYNYANGLADPMLDQGQDLGGLTRGRDFKMMAAAFLYNVTGTQAWEDVVNEESVCASGVSVLKDNTRNQIWGTAAYLMTPQAVRYPTLQSNMRAAIIAQAKSEEASLISSRPSRRATDRSELGYFHMAQNVHRTIIAHAVATTQADKDLFRKALGLEADWGLGRNPLNWIQMTTASTPLSSKRSVGESYTSGMDDGEPGVHPGHTPYFNLNDWDSSMTMGRPSDLFENGYPTNAPVNWPIAEAAFPSRWVWAHTEFTPQQTMTGKMALYGYLYGLAAAEAPANPTLTVSKSGGGSGTVTSNPSGISCGSDCSEEYTNGTTVTLTAGAASGSRFVGWSGACYGPSASCSVVMAAHRSVTATFEPVGLTYTLTVGKSGTGSGTVSSSPAGIDCGSDCSEAYLSGASVVLSATPLGGSTFTGWSGACSGTGTCTLTMSAARSVTAAFMSSVVPTVTIYGDSLASGWGNWSWGGEINLSATSPAPKVGSSVVTATLDGWGAFSPATQSAVIDTYGYDAVKFWIHGGSANKTLSFTTQDVADGGASSTEVSVSAVANTWAEITIPLSALGNPPAIARLNFFNASSDAQFRFSLDEIRLVPGNTSSYPLTVAKTGNGIGTVTSSPSGIQCGDDCSETYPNGTGVTLTAAPGAGSSFGGWSGACTGTALTCTVTMDAVRSVTAAFDVAVAAILGIDDVSTSEGSGGVKTITFTVSLGGNSSPVLTVAKTGTGVGTVISSPSGISCGSDCSEAYLSGTSVTLTPYSAAGTTFGGWGGACTGTGACTVSMSAARNVTAAFSGGSVAGGVRYVGRVDASNPNAVRFAWQGAGLVALATGPTVSVRLQTSGAETVYFQPVIDGVPGSRFEVTQGAVRTITLASGLAAGTHVVELYRETEGMYGVSTFTGFASGTVTGAPASTGRFVEVVGDSVSAGYGNLGVEPHPNWVPTPACHWTAENSAWFQTYAAIAGRACGAEVSTIARSGWGMSRDREGNASGVLSSVYANAVGTDDSTPWGFDPDASVVIINLGTNDIAPGDPGTAYETAYTAFLQTVRARYPNAWIFATIGSMLDGSDLASIKTHMTNVLSALGDPKVVTFDMGTQPLGSNGEIPTGCDWHPNVADHQRMAEIIRARLQTHLGW